MQDPKQSAEHATIVDLIRNDLNRIAYRVRVDRYRYTERIHTDQGSIIQVSSQISGDLDSDFKAKIGDIILATLPAGSVTGAPKEKTVSIIRDVEDHDRGFYTGIMGYFDGKNLDSGVMIRFIEQSENGLVYKSGGGITTQSTCTEEYDEMIQKIYVPIA